MEEVACVTQATSDRGRKEGLAVLIAKSPSRSTNKHTAKQRTGHCLAACVHEGRTAIGGCRCLSMFTDIVNFTDRQPFLSPSITIHSVAGYTFSNRPPSFWIYYIVSPFVFHIANFTLISPTPMSSQISGQLATAMATPSPAPHIDSSRGQVVFINGRRYFSPNCRRLVHIYDKLEKYEPESDPRRNTRYMLLEPKYWNPDMPYVPFTKVQQEFLAPPFSTLNYIETKRRRSRLNVDAGKLLLWHKLEVDMKSIVTVLWQRYKVDSGDFILQGDALALVVAAGYEGRLGPTYLTTDLHTTRSWLMFHLGHLSYLIACATALDGEDPNFSGVPT